MRDNGGQIFGYGRLVEEVTIFTDSNLAGCKETRKSSSAGLIMLGDHALKAYTRKQKIIARSSAEAELYAAAWESVCVERNRVVVERSGTRDEASVGY